MMQGVFGVNGGKERRKSDKKKSASQQWPNIWKRSRKTHCPAISYRQRGMDQLQNNVDTQMFT